MNSIHVIKLAGETIAVNEFDIKKGLQATPYLEAILEDLRILFTQNGDYTIPEVERVFAKHTDAFLNLLALSTGKPIDWISNLKGHEGFALFIHFWTANQPFFRTRILAAIKTREVDDRLKAIRNTPRSHPLVKH